MKKLIILTALSVAGFMSANSNVKADKETLHSFVSHSPERGGYCSITVYRVNADVTRTILGIYGGNANSQEECEAKAASITGLIRLGVDPESNEY